MKHCPYPRGTAAWVIAHAASRRCRGKRPSATLGTFRNPAIALVKAIEINRQFINHNGAGRCDVCHEQVVERTTYKPTTDLRSEWFICPLCHTNLMVDPSYEAEVKESAESSKRVRILKEPMLECLTRIIKEVSDQLPVWEEKVFQATGKKMRIMVLQIGQIAPDHWLISLEATNWCGNRKLTTFSIRWLELTAPTRFALFEYCLSDCKEHLQLFFNHNCLAEELTILLFGQQIPGVLSRAA